MDKKTKLIIIIFVVIFAIIIVGVLGVYIANMLNNDTTTTNEATWKKNIVPVTVNSLEEGYYVKDGNNFYEMPRVSEKDMFKITNSSYKIGDVMYILDDSKIPVIDLDQNTTNLVYKSEDLPKGDLKVINLETVVGITLDENDVVKTIINPSLSNEYVGYTCKILSEDNAKIENNDVIVDTTSSNKTVKLAFLKGTIYKEVEVKQIIGKGIILNPYIEGNITEDMTITKDSYALVENLKDYQIPTGYYLIDGYVFRINQSSNVINEDADLDMENQVKNIENYNNYSDIKKELNITDILPKDITVYNEVRKYDENDKKHETFTSTLGESVKLQNNYYCENLVFNPNDSVILSGQRFYRGTIKVGDTKNNYYNVYLLIDEENIETYYSLLEEYYEKTDSQVKKESEQIDKTEFIGFYGELRGETTQYGAVIE